MLTFQYNLHAITFMCIILTAYSRHHKPHVQEIYTHNNSFVTFLSRIYRLLVITFNTAGHMSGVI